MRRILILFTLLIIAVAARADYSDYLSVGTYTEQVENGGTVIFCRPSHINAGFPNNWYDYELEIIVRNHTSEELNVNCIFAWGSYPTAEEYVEHYGERIPGTDRRVYGYAKMCAGGYCFSPNLPANLGGGIVKVKGGGKLSVMCQLLNTPLDLVSEYTLVVYPHGHAMDRFSCKIVFAPSEDAAREFLENRPSGITDISAGADVVDVFTLQGMPVVSKGHPDILDTLPGGIYIINGKKVRITK